MNWLKKFKDRLTGLTDAISRFPLTTLFLLAAAVVNAYSISTEKADTKLLLTFILGAFLSAVAQVSYERFFSKYSSRLALMGAAIILTGGYYLIVRPAPNLSTEIEIRTVVAMFALLWAFIWVPVAKSNTSFDKSFMITFKSFFISLFFSSIIYGGISIILVAFNELIFKIEYTAYPHTANLIFILFAPLYFLSLIPDYSRAKDDTVDQAAHCPTFLRILLSYIFIPLVAMFTLILVLYIFKNITGAFWDDNLLEPMLVSYAITVILLYILVSELENKFTVLFRKVFPKVLIPIVLFQVASSVISLNESGVTHTRYYVILFGVFAIIAGVLLSFLPVRKNGILAALLIIFSAISIVPPVDAFTISRNSQVATLEDELLKYDMLENNKIKPNDSVSEKDRKIITNTVQYLDRMGYTKEIAWLPRNFDVYKDFYDTFGFHEYQESGDENQPVYLTMEPSMPINIEGFDRFIQMDLYPFDNDGKQKINDFEKAGKTYTLVTDTKGKRIDLKLVGEDSQELIRFNTQEIFDKFYHYNATKGTITAEEATFTKENRRAKLTIVVQNVSIEKQANQNNAGIFVFIQIK
ncbi:uncharacterized protein DUF4153 [Neobacillus bataviensis]|uniref:Uncharacterized protein DUF4153 n=1 Tax=Neobacillus bataviensis TaxID=220685 RepID=A0A561DCB0_9BACI|nr:DUF4153 domain-containing protein [Neobacillus bataviensis]TWE01042.1 uncharacterized protein DUF4153 [Neobacillus bataviensis]